MSNEVSEGPLSNSPGSYMCTTCGKEGLDHMEPCPDCKSEVATPAKVELTDEQKDKAVDFLLKQVIQGSINQDPVRQIVLHPDLSAPLSEALNESDYVTDQAMSMLSITPNIGDREITTLIRQSDIEYAFLSRYYNAEGLPEAVAKAGAPLVLGHLELKMIFLWEKLLECRANTPQIVKVGAGGIARVG